MRAEIVDLREHQAIPWAVLLGWPAMRAEIVDLREKAEQEANATATSPQ